MTEEQDFTPRELDAWVAIGALVEGLPAALDAELQRIAGVSHFEFVAMLMLADAPDGHLRMTELAEFANASASRLSHSAARLAARGWLERRPDPADGRATLASLTPAGVDLVARVAPAYAGVIRRLVFAPLGADLADSTAEAARRIMAIVRPGHECVPPSRLAAREPAAR